MKNTGFPKSHAVLIGIDQYRFVHALQSAAGDAQALGLLLERQHDYKVTYCLNQAATLGNLRTVFEQLPSQVGEEDRLLLYFAGHGIAEEAAVSSAEGAVGEGPQGFLVPQDAIADDAATLLPMAELYRKLDAIACRHLLLILDCCFAGAFRWSGHRAVIPSRRRQLYRERFERYQRERASQVLTSAAHDERALDVLDGRVLGARQGSQSDHSPFATALLAALAGAADGNQDGILLATEVYSYIESHFAVLEQRAGKAFQRPSISSMRLRDRSEYFFFNPTRPAALESAVELNEQHNPYRGLHAYRPEDHEFFFGRDPVIEKLAAHVRTCRFVAVLGSSGVGKSSLIHAGLLPRLEREVPHPWQVLGSVRPGSSPLTALRQVVSQLPAVAEESAVRNDSPPLMKQQAQRLLAQLKQYGTGRQTVPLLLVVDQLEELVTLCNSEDERHAFLGLLAQLAREKILHIVVTLRSDFEPQFIGQELQPLWSAARFVVPLPDREDLRKIIEGPAEARVLHFEPPELVERLIDAVHQMPGALPLLSFTLSELYMKRISRAPDDRALTASDYESLGGVIGALQHRIEVIYSGLAETAGTDEEPTKLHMRRLLLRLVSIEGGERARRRIPLSELDFGSPQENEYFRKLREKLLDARLLVQGHDETGSGEAYLEPAHDAMVCGWSRLSDWLRQEQSELPFARRLTQAAGEWKRGQGPLWNADPRLGVALGMAKEANRCNALEQRFLLESDRSRRARARWLIAGVSVAFLAVSTAAGIAFYQRQEALKQTIRANKQTEVANAKTQEAIAQKSNADKNAAERDQQAVRAKENARRADKNAEKAKLEARNAQNAGEAEKREARQARDVNRLKLAQEHWSSDPTVSALYLASIEETREQWQKQAALLAQKPLSIAELSGHKGVVADARFSPDGAWVVTAGYDGTARLHRESGLGPALPPVKHPAPVITAVFSPDGKFVATGAEDGSVGWFSAQAPGRAVVRKLHDNMVHSLAFSPDGQTLATVSRDGTVGLWQIGDELGRRRSLTGHGGAVWAVAFSPPRGEQVLTAGEDGLVRVWQASSGKLLDTLPGESQGQIGQVTYSSDASLVVAALWSGAVREWNLSTQPVKQRDYLTGRTKRVDRVLFGPTRDNDKSPSAFLLALTQEGLRTEWRDQSHASELVRTTRGSESIELSANGHDLASNASTEGSEIPVIFSLSNGHAIAGRYLIGHKRAVRSIHFALSGHGQRTLRVVTASDDGSARIWSLLPPSARSAEKEPNLFLEDLRRFTSICLSVQQRMAIIPDQQKAEQEFYACERRNHRIPAVSGALKKDKTAPAGEPGAVERGS